MNGKRMPRWPLYLIAAPAAIAVWSGWVGLGQLCGFGVIHPLPGIWDAARLNTAITLPVGIEAYAAYALGAWLTPGASKRARRFAKRSALGALVLGMAGQVAFHLLSAAHAARAPWPVVTLVACLPVAVMGLGTALAHLLAEPGEDVPAQVTIPEPETTSQTVADADSPVRAQVDVPAQATTPAPGAAWETVTDAVPMDVPADVPEIALVDVRVDEVSTPAASVPETVPAKRAPRRPTAGKPKSPERIFATELAGGELPSLRAIKTRAKCGTDKARIIRDELAQIMEAQPKAA